MEALNSTPKHVAIIMDGNGRWAKERGLLRVEGHRKGGDSIFSIVEAAQKLQIEHVTFYAFSKENWARPKAEVNFLMRLLGDFLDSQLKKLKANNIRFDVIGRIGELPVEVQKKIKRNIDETKNNSGIHATLALSYSSRTEILDAVKQIASDVRAGKLEPDEITETLFSKRLYTAGTPDPDLLIRTSGEQRISNFLLWQISYTELYITNKFWPDFGASDFNEAVEVYKKRNRRFGLSDPEKALS